jgi:hypothetical protein
MSDRSVGKLADGPGTSTVQPRKTHEPAVWVTTTDGAKHIEGGTLDFIIADGQEKIVTQGGVSVVTPATGTMSFFASSEMSFDAHVVKGTPFSAVAVTESTQLWPTETESSAERRAISFATAKAVHGANSHSPRLAPTLRRMVLLSGFSSTTPSQESITCWTPRRRQLRRIRCPRSE